MPSGLPQYNKTNHFAVIEFVCHLDASLKAIVVGIIMKRPCKVKGIKRTDPSDGAEFY
jgi:hypothetical protein